MKDEAELFQGRQARGRSRRDHIDLEIRNDVLELVEVDDGETIMTKFRRCSGHSFDCDRGTMRIIHCTRDSNVHYIIPSLPRNRFNFSKLVLKPPILYFMSRDV